MIYTPSRASANKLNSLGYLQYWQRFLSSHFPFFSIGKSTPFHSSNLKLKRIWDIKKKIIKLRFLTVVVKLRFLTAVVINVAHFTVYLKIHYITEDYLPKFFMQIYLVPVFLSQLSPVRLLPSVVTQPSADDVPISWIGLKTNYKLTKRLNF